MSDSARDYKIILTNIIKNQIIILGPAITLAKVRHVRGLSVTEDGTVTSLSEKPEVIINQLRDQFSELSAFITKKTLAPVLEQTQPTPSSAEEANEETVSNDVRSGM
jgi:hypothetical protein